MSNRIIAGFVRPQGITAKALIVGSTAVLASAGIMTLFAARGVTDLGDKASVEIQEIVDDQISSYNAGNRDLVASRAGLVQETVDLSLIVATDVFDRAGPVGLGSEPVAWSVTNQFTKETTDIELPRFETGGSWLGKNADPTMYSPVVDDIFKLVGGTATVFQRMNEEGDMLRVTTNVERLDGTRATGTYIPAVNPDGSANGVVSTVLGGETFRGTAFVVNAWYVTAYQPIFNAADEVVGILYVGVRQDEAGGLVDTLKSSTFGENGATYALGSKGKRADTFEFAPNGINVETAPSSLVDEAGEAYLPALTEAAVAAGGTPVSHQYRVDDTDHLVVASYFETWDWVIVTDANLNDFAGAANEVSSYGDELIQNLMLIGLVSAVIIAAGTALYLRRSIARPIERATVEMLGAVRSLQDLSGELGETSHEGAVKLEGVLGIANEVAEHSEAQSELVGSLNEILDQTLDQSIRSREVGERAADKVQQGHEALVALGEASAGIETVVEMITDVAAQTKLLSLNATIEAARAGELGKGFAVVAGEVKNLAAETETATDQISARVEAISEHSSRVRETIDGIQSAVVGLVEVQDAISGSIEGQQQTVREIENRALRNREATGQVVDATGDAMRTARENMDRASSSVQASDELREIVAGLEALSGHRLN